MGKSSVGRLGAESVGSVAFRWRHSHCVNDWVQWLRGGVVSGLGGGVSVLGGGVESSSGFPC